MSHYIPVSFFTLMICKNLFQCVRLIKLLYNFQRTAGTCGLTGLDRLLCFMIVQELQNFATSLLRSVQGDKGLLEALTKLSKEIDPVSGLISMCLMCVYIWGEWETDAQYKASQYFKRLQGCLHVALPVSHETPCRRRTRGSITPSPARARHQGEWTRSKSGGRPWQTTS